MYYVALMMEKDKEIKSKKQQNLDNKKALRSWTKNDKGEFCAECEHDVEWLI